MVIYSINKRGQSSPLRLSAKTAALVDLRPPIQIHNLPGSDGRLLHSKDDPFRSHSSTSESGAMSAWPSGSAFNFGLFALSAAVLLMLCALTLLSLLRLRSPRIRRFPLLSGIGSTGLEPINQRRHIGSNSAQSFRLSLDASMRTSASGKCLAALKGGGGIQSSEVSDALQQNRPNRTDTNAEDLHCALSGDGCCELDYCDHLVITNAMATQLARTYSTGLTGLTTRNSISALHDNLVGGRLLSGAASRVHASTGRLYEQLRQRSYAELSTIGGGMGGCAGVDISGADVGMPSYLSRQDSLLNNQSASSMFVSAGPAACMGGSMGRLPTPPPPYTELAAVAVFQPIIGNQIPVTSSAKTIGLVDSRRFACYSAAQRSGYATWAFRRTSEKHPISFLSKAPTETVAPLSSFCAMQPMSLASTRAPSSIYSTQPTPSSSIYCTQPESRSTTSKCETEKLKPLDPYYAGTTTLVVDVSGLSDRQLHNSYATIWNKQSATGRKLTDSTVLEPFSSDSTTVSDALRSRSDSMTKESIKLNDEPLIALHDDDDEQDAAEEQLEGPKDKEAKRGEKSEKSIADILCDPLVSQSSDQPTGSETL